MTFAKWMGAIALAASLALQAASVHASPQVGWWWNPNESGSGFFVESQNGVTFIGAYFYDADGHCTWLAAGGPNSDPYNYTGPLYSKANGQTLFGSYVAPGPANNVGTVSVHFSDDTHGTLTWPGGTVAIERQIFGGTGASFQLDSGWWWNPDESGSGYSVELQGKNLFIVGFMYDAGGRPVWYFSAGPMNSDTTYSGKVLQFANGQTMGGPYQPPGLPATVATLDVAFTAADHATLTFTEASASIANRMVPTAVTSKSENIQREFATPREYAFPDWFIGEFHEDVTLTDWTFGIVSGNGHSTVTGKNVTWQLNRIDPASGGAKTATYIMLGGEMTLVAHAQSMVQDPDLGTVTCTADVNGTVPMRYPFTSSAVLSINDSGSYTLDLVFDQAAFALPGTFGCVGEGNGVLDGFDAQLPTLPIALVDIGRVNILRAVSGGVPPISFPVPVGSGTVTATGDYDFFESNDCNTAFCPAPPP